MLINSSNVTLEILDELLPNYRIFHQTGVTHEDSIRTTAEALLKDNPDASNYYLVGAIPASTVSRLYDAASVVVTRAGSTTLFEIAAHGKPSIIIPIPETVSRDQKTNAYAFAGTGAASVIEEKNLSQHLLIEEIETIIRDQGRWQQMAHAARERAIPEAATKIAGILHRIAKEHE